MYLWWSEHTDSKRIARETAETCFMIGNCHRCCYCDVSTTYCHNQNNCQHDHNQQQHHHLLSLSSSLLMTGLSPPYVLEYLYWQGFCATCCCHSASDMA
mmetsp:Transcript_24846/g.69111  ORF Transcript_24846/g.69111 Transcript_24846/m.69111 type:complete len:99 (-) Transcript_24846:411-707(-)